MEVLFDKKIRDQYNYEECESLLKKIVELTGAGRAKQKRINNVRKIMLKIAGCDTETLDEYIRKIEIMPSTLNIIMNMISMLPSNGIYQRMLLDQILRTEG